MQLVQLHFWNQSELLALSAGSIKQVPVSFTVQLRHRRMKIQFSGQEAHMQRQN
jgi:hypothetical protein